MAFLVADKITTAKGEPLEAGMIRQHGGEIITITKNMLAGLEPEKMAEKPKEETEGG